MINNNISKWEPIDGIPNQLYLDSILNDHNGLTISASRVDNNDILLLNFRSVISYQNTDETNVLKRLDTSPILSMEWPLFICNQSDYIDWLIEGSYQIVIKEGLSHFIVTHSDGILDIISYQLPEIKWL